MRCDQHKGLPKEALEFLEKNKIVPLPCPHCKRPFPPERKSNSVYLGMFGDEYPLWEYPLKDGRTAKEEVQASPWSSGPNFFIRLVISDGIKFEWEEKQIDEV